MPDGPWAQYQPQPQQAPWLQYKQPSAAQDGVFDRLWEGFKMGFGEGSTSDPLKAAGAVPSRMAYRTAQGIGEGVGALTLPMRGLLGEAQPAPATEGQTGAQRDTARTLPGAMLMAGQGWRAPKITEAAPMDSVWERLKGAPAGMSIKDVSETAPAGGRVEPLPATDALIAPPSFSPGLQPPRPVAGAMPPPVQNAPAAPPGGATVPERPPPVIPPGQQPPPLTGQPVGPQRPGISAPPGAVAASVRPLPEIATGPQPPRPANMAGIPGPPRPAPPAPAGGISEATISPLAQAIAGNDGMAMDRQLTRAYRRAVKPGPLGQPSIGGLNTQDQRILTAVDRIIDNRPNLRLTDAGGQEIAQQLPRSLRQFAEALDQTKRGVFQKYDQMAQTAGQGGVRIDLTPVVARLRQVAQQPEVIDLHPAVAADANRLADTMAARGTYSPGEAQDVIQNLNKTLAGFWRNPTNETVSRSALLAPVTTILRDQLDKAIEGAQGPGYQALRYQYQALRTVEKDVAAAVQREANKIPGGMVGMFADLGATEEAIRGVLTLNPVTVARAGGIKVAKKALQYINDPNRAITRMFAHRAASANPVPSFRPGMTAMGAQSGGQVGERGPLGGEIIARRRFPAAPPPMPNLPGMQ
jgi:hypothetical protein